MGLIRSGQTALTSADDEQLTNYLWPIVREIIKTALENEQNLFVEGCYIPFDRKNDFEKCHLDHIRYCCLVMSERYIHTHFCDIRAYANAIEKRKEDDCTMESVLADNARMLRQVQENALPFVLIDDTYTMPDTIVFAEA